MSLILNCGCGPVSSWESNIELLTLSGELMVVKYSTVQVVGELMGV